MTDSQYIHLIVTIRNLVTDVQPGDIQREIIEPLILSDGEITPLTTFSLRKLGGILKTIAAHIEYQQKWSTVP